MNYLKEYGIKDEEIEKIKEKYNDGIIEFIEQNEVYIRNTIGYLYSENIKCIYWLMINNIKIFLETKVALEEDISDMKEQGMNIKEIQMRLLQGD